MKKIVLYIITVILSGLPLYGMSTELMKPNEKNAAAEQGATKKTATREQVHEFTEAAAQGTVGPIMKFVKTFPDCINAKDRYGRTALWAAVDGFFWKDKGQGCWAAFAYLVIHGANARLTGEVGEKTNITVADFIKMGSEYRIEAVHKQDVLIGMKEEWREQWRKGHEESVNRFLEYLQKALKNGQSEKEQAEQEAREKAEKEAREKAIALAIFNQKRQEDRKAKEVAKLLASVALSAPDESKQLEMAEAQLALLKEDIKAKTAIAVRLSIVEAEATQEAWQAEIKLAEARKRIEELKKKITNPHI